MTDPENITNVTPLHPTVDRIGADRKKKAAERSRRYRKRKQQPQPVTRHASPVTQRDASTGIDKARDGHNAVTVTEPTAAPRDGVTVSTLAAALALATVSGGFSIFGMTAVFAGAFWPVIGMGIALEAGKLSAVAWLGRHGRTASRRLKAGLVALVAVLMMLNAIGAYGFLAKAHIGHALAGDLAVSSRTADIDARISVQAGKVADLTKQIADLDAARPVEAPAAGNLRTAAAINAQAAALAAAAKLRAAADERRQAKRDSLADRLAIEAKSLADLKVEKVTVEGERRTVEADLGPVRYLATLIGADNETVLRWFILVVALLLDPAAVLLLLAATRAPRAVP